MKCLTDCRASRVIDSAETYLHFVIDERDRARIDNKMLCAELEQARKERAHFEQQYLKYRQENDELRRALGDKTNAKPAMEDRKDAR